jgi:hypothetical protein
VAGVSEPGTGQAEVRPAPARDTAVLRRMTLGAGLLVLVQAGLGIVVNLYVTVPAHHPGAQPPEYFSGSFRSVIWSIQHGAAALAVHAALGLALVLMVVAVAARAVAARAGWVTFTSVLGALLVIAAGFNGASFLDFGYDVSSLLMELLALAALGCYLVGGFLLAGRGGGPRAR